MGIPGFTGAASLDSTRRHYGGRSSQRHQAVRGQLKGGGFRPRLGGTFGTLEDYWTCKERCYTAKKACLDTCEGTWGSPMGSSRCIVCDQDYNACMQGCTRDIA
jgi:hypothetical protein